MQFIYNIFIQLLNCITCKYYNFNYNFNSSLYPPPLVRQNATSNFLDIYSFE